MRKKRFFNLIICFQLLIYMNSSERKPQLILEQKLNGSQLKPYFMRPFIIQRAFEANVSEDNQKNDILLENKLSYDKMVQKFRTNTSDEVHNEKSGFIRQLIHMAFCYYLL